MGRAEVNAAYGGTPKNIENMFKLKSQRTVSCRTADAVILDISVLLRKGMIKD